MKLQQVNQEIITSAVSSLIITGINTDDPYMLTVRDWAPTEDTRVLRLRVTKSGVAQTASYYQAHKSMSSTGSFSNGLKSNNTDFEFTFTASAYKTNAIMWLYDFNASDKESHGLFETVGQDHSGNSTGLKGSFSHHVSSASDGIEFRMHAGNVASGTFTLYKVIT